MRILWVLPYLPWPTTSGGKTRQYHLLRSLSELGHSITLLAQSKAPLNNEARDALEPLVQRLIVLPRRSVTHPLTLLGAIFAPWPLLATVNGLAPSLQRHLAELLEEPWDIVQIEHSYSFQPCAKPLKECGQPFLLTEHNLESALGAATYNRFPGFMAPFVRYDQWRARRWERLAFNLAQRIIAVTTCDAKAFEHLTATPINVVVNGVDTRAYAHVRADTSSQRILFLGNYEYAPNADAVQWALDEILPKVWKLCPQARFTVAGHALPATWAQRWPDPRIEWPGFTPNLSALQQQCSIFLAPLRHGGGSKLKVLEALAAGLPLVSTAQGVSGLDLHDGHDYRTGKTATQLAAALIELLEAPTHAAWIAENGRRYVQEHHDWQTAATQLEAVYQQIANPP